MHVAVIMVVVVVVGHSCGRGCVVVVVIYHVYGGCDFGCGGDCHCSRSGRGVGAKYKVRVTTTPDTSTTPSVPVVCRIRVHILPGHSASSARQSVSVISPRRSKTSLTPTTPTSPGLVVRLAGDPAGLRSACEARWAQPFLNI